MSNTKTKWTILIILIMLFLSGCSLIDPSYARRRYLRKYPLKAAKEAYIGCLKLKNDPLECEQLKRIWEIELETYKAHHPPYVKAPTVIIRDRGGQVIQQKN